MIAVASSIDAGEGASCSRGLPGVAKDPQQNTTMEVPMPKKHGLCGAKRGKATIDCRMKPVSLEAAGALSSCFVETIQMEPVFPATHLASKSKSKTASEVRAAATASDGASNDQDRAAIPSNDRNNGNDGRARDLQKVIGKTDFNGERVHMVQIGLGNFKTFFQYLTGNEYSYDLSWLLWATGFKRRAPIAKFKGVAVEPVKKLVKGLEAYTAELKESALVQVAIGKEEANDCPVYVVDLEGCLAKVNGKRKKKRLRRDLATLCNMSSVGGAHPEFEIHRQHLLLRYGVEPEFTLEPTDVWSYSHLSKALNFSGCQVLLIDAEGYDTSILRSLVEHCRKVPAAWPGLIQFETMGHCDKREQCDAERLMRDTLVENGYTVICLGFYDTTLVRTELLAKEKHPVAEWANSWYCYECEEGSQFPLTELIDWNIVCPSCMDKLSSGTEDDAGHPSPAGSLRDPVGCPGEILRTSSPT